MPRGEHSRLTWLMAALLCVSLSLSGTACQEASSTKTLPSGTERISLITIGILQGNMAPFERHYSRGRVRHFGDPARVATVVDRLVAEARAKGRTPIVLDLGDNLSGSAEALLTKGAITARVLGDLPLTASLLGNLEFAHGQAALVEYAKKYSIPFVASNVSRSDGTQLAFAKPYVVTTAGQLRILISGLVPPNLKFVCLPGNVAGLEVLEGLNEPFKEAAKAKIRNKCQLSIMLTQESLGTESKGLAAALENSEIDVLFGLDFDREGDVRVVEGARLLAFPGHNQGQRIRITELDVHPTQGILAVDSWFDMVDADVEKPKASVHAYLDEARRSFRAQLDKEVGRADKYLNREFWTDGDAGNIMTDALREHTGADIAVINSGGVASSFAPGPIKLRDLYRVIPYQNRVVSLDVSGQAFRRFLDETLGRGSPLQVSKLFLRLARKGVAERGFRVLHAQYDGQDIDPAATYRIATNDFVLGRSPQLVPKEAPQTGPLMRDVLLEYLKKHVPVKRPSRGRVVIEGE